LKLLGRGRWRSLGIALAGFGLIFIGIETLQDAMRGMSGVFNLATGLIAVVSLPAFLWVIARAQEHAGLDPGATSLAAFHTGFIAVGVAISLPFVQRFSRTIERILPDRGPT